MDDETRGELIEDAEASRAISEMVNTIGWQKIVMPQLEVQKEIAFKDLVTKTDMREIIRAQETIKAIDRVFSDLMYKTKIGDEAAKTLAKEKDND